MPALSKFFWYELMTTDREAAERFYTAVVGWTAEPFGSPGAMPYTVVSAGGRPAGGMMTMPEEARQGGMPPGWIGYIHTTDIDRAVHALEEAGGKVHRAPDDIPGVGRFAVVADPQGAIFQFLQPEGSDQPPVPMTTPGHVGWHELYTTDWAAAFDFYSGQFGWTKGEPFDMGEMGIYQIFHAGGEPVGGMMNKPDNMPSPVWQFYFNVEDIDAAAARVSANGGTIVMGPQEVPGGSRILMATDPQGAWFALVAQRRR